MNTRQFERFKRKSIQVSSSNLIETGYLQPGLEIPFVIQPAVGNIDLLAWTSNNLETIEVLLLKHKALLFRNFKITTVARFNEFVKATTKEALLAYCDRSSPRHEVGDKIYTSTDYPAEQSIFLHNENSYALTFPGKIYFCCLQVAQQGGETPIADTRKIWQRLNPEICDCFLAKQIMYVRNYNDGFGLSWQTVFQTKDKTVVEDYCHKNQIEFEWKDNNRLRTRQVRPAVIKHPITGEISWFNHAAFFHVSTLEPTIRDALLAEFEIEDLPHNTYYGDGTAVAPSILEEIRSAYQQETVIFPWEAGDILLLDNLSVAHGRKPFVGARKVLVGMAESWKH
jgi:alpha-ketoglutarate-dependent taurine dioxygenase